MTKPPVFFFTYANDRQHSLDLPNEWRKVEEALHTLHDSKRIEFNLTPSTNKGDLWDKFNRFHNRISVFHYGGHSNPDGLLLTEKLLSGQKLTTLLSQEEGLRLVFLNGCSNVVQEEQLLDKGVAAVIATSASIEDGRASRLAEQFYKALASGRTIQQAFEVAAAYVNDQEEEVLVKIYRTDALLEDTLAVFPWGLYTSAENQLDWKIPSLSDVAAERSSGSGQQVHNHGPVNKQININTNEGTINL